MFYHITSAAVENAVTGKLDKMRGEYYLGISKKCDCG